MKLLSWVRSEEGFTIQELLVVLVVSSLLVGFSLSLFLFVNKLFLTWEQQSELQSVVSRTLQVIALDVLESKHHVEISNTSVVLMKNTGRTIVYRFDGKHVWRDNVLIGILKDALLKVVIKHSSISSIHHDVPPLIHINIVGKSKSVEFQNQMQVKIPNSGKNEFLESSINVH